MKDEVDNPGPFRFGAWDQAGQGRRSDVVGIVNEIKKNPYVRHLDLAATFPSSARMVPFVRIAKLESQVPRDSTWEEVKGVWLCGETGTGKSTYAKATWPSAYWKRSNNKWFDNYNGEVVVVVDEFSGSVSAEHIKMWINITPCKVEVKGGAVELQATTFVFISEEVPWCLPWYLQLPYKVQAAIRRRFGGVALEFDDEHVRVEKEWPQPNPQAASVPGYNRFSV